MAYYRKREVTESDRVILSYMEEICRVKGISMQRCALDAGLYRAFFYNLRAGVGRSAKISINVVINMYRAHGVDFDMARYLEAE